MAIIGAAIGCALCLLACGPNFPNRLLLLGDKAVLATPSADFRRELERFGIRSPLRSVPPREDSDVFAQSAEADVAELAKALGVDPKTDERVRAYARVRAARGDGKPADTKLAAIPAGLPPEFDDYLRGLVLHDSGESAKAREHWTRLLGRGREARGHRSVWAAYMLGKSYLQTDSARSVEWFRKTRELVSDGFTDPIGLAASSLGWEALAELNSGNLTRALDLYLEQLASGDPTALMSLRIVAGRIVSGDAATLAGLAKNLASQRVITAYLVSRTDRRAGAAPIPQAFTAAWLGALEASGVADVRSADRLAWAAYQAGNMAGAERWLKVAPAGSPLGQWLRAKLLLRAGKPDDAVKLLAEASRAFPADVSWSWLGTDSDSTDESITSRELTLGEAGVILLARRHYAEALDSLLHGGFWVDAAYVGERVLTLDELRAYVDRVWGPGEVTPDKPGEWKPEHADAKTLGFRLRYLLARRLARAQRFAEAAGYMPTAHAPKLKDLAKFLGEGRDKARSAPDRAAALMAAARLTRAEGLELIGTELAPDSAVHGGQFSRADIEPGERSAEKSKHVPASKDEIRRAAGSGPDPDRRFHYRFVAAKLAWEAAELMPDQADATASVLCEAGSWIKNDDPREADRFYKALVNRCGKTALGQDAEKRKWFPPGK